MPLSEAEIAERVAADDGPQDEAVLLKRSTSGTRHVYHDVEDPCFTPTQEGDRGPPETTTRADALDRGLAPCRRCILGFESSRDHNMTPQMVARTFDPERHDSLREARAELEAGD